MITNELKHRNEKYRKQILNHLNGYPTGEKFLIAFLISRLEDFSPFNKYPYIFDFEYLPFPPYDNLGRGDLILTSGRKYYLVVEAKYLSDESGRTARKSRNSDRQLVEFQAVKYGVIFLRQNPNFVVNYTTLTNDRSWRNEHPNFCREFLKFQNKKKKEYDSKNNSI